MPMVPTLRGFFHYMPCWPCRHRRPVGSPRHSKPHGIFLTSCRPYKYDVPTFKTAVESLNVRTPRPDALASSVPRTGARESWIGWLNGTSYVRQRSLKVSFSTSGRTTCGEATRGGGATTCFGDSSGPLLLHPARAGDGVRGVSGGVLEAKLPLSSPLMPLSPPSIHPAPALALTDFLTKVVAAAAVVGADLDGEHGSSPSRDNGKDERNVLMIDDIPWTVLAAAAAWEVGVVQLWDGRAPAKVRPAEEGRRDIACCEVRM